MPALVKPTRFLIFLFLLFGGLYFAQSILIPLTVAGLLAMLFLPLSNWLEKKGINRAVAALLCIFCFLAAIAGIGLLLTWQASDLTQDLTGVEKRITTLVDQAKSFVSSRLGVDPQQQKQMMQKQQSGGGSQVASFLKTGLSSLLGIMVNVILVLVYIFLLMYFRAHLKAFLLRLVTPGDKTKTRQAIAQSTKVAQRYLTGMAIMTGLLWVLYGIGFSIVGVKHAIFLAILCGLLEIIPFVGNLTGTGITILVSLGQGGDSRTILGILIVYGLVQFIQTYLLEPLAVGNDVNINPLFTILVIVIGETVWGIPGMILALPTLAILKIICDKVEPLQPYGFLLGEVGQSDEGGFAEKIKKPFSKK